MKFGINGRFLARKLTGQERFAIEILNEVDKIIDKNTFILIVPKYVSDHCIPKYDNISVVKYGNVKKHFWEQISLCRYLKRNKLIGVNLTTTCPYFKPDITCIHDISYHMNGEWFKDFYGRLSKAWHKLLASAVFKKSPIIFTVSEFSKQQMVSYCHVDVNKIVVLGNGWNHFQRVDEDDAVFEKYNFIRKNEYIFAASSITPQKNFIWVKKMAETNPNHIFIIAGSKEKLKANLEFENIPKNMIFLGYVTDSEMKALMKYSKAFVHPALFEGFGITPLEALSTGAKVLVSDIPIFREIYGDSVIYFDPRCYSYKIEDLLSTLCSNPQSVLDKYTWKNMASILVKSLNERFKL